MIFPQKWAMNHVSELSWAAIHHTPILAFGHMRRLGVGVPIIIELGSHDRPWRANAWVEINMCEKYLSPCSPDRDVEGRWNDWNRKCYRTQYFHYRWPLLELKHSPGYILARLYFGAWVATPSPGQSSDIKTRRYIHLKSETKPLQ